MTHVDRSSTIVDIVRTRVRESVGSFGWGGAYGSTYEVDPKEHLVLVFMIQMLPNRSDVAMKFPMLVYQALVEPRS